MWARRRGVGLNLRITITVAAAAAAVIWFVDANDVTVMAIVAVTIIFNFIIIPVALKRFPAYVWSSFIRVRVVDVCGSADWAWTTTEE